jgi:hypothetical protein
VSAPFFPSRNYLARAPSPPNIAIPVTCLFTHEIDSRGYTSPDLGVFTELPNGDFLEVGSMPWPEQDNKVTSYEEIWHEYPAPPAGSVSWIVRNDDPENGITFLGRLEGSFLAFRKNEKEGFTAVREEMGKEGWKVVYRIGDGEVPRAEGGVGCDFQGIKEGGKVQILGVEYLVCAVAVEGKE